MGSRASLFAVVLLAAGCTTPNPLFSGGEANDASLRDGPRAADARVGDGARPPRDQGMDESVAQRDALPPDLAPVACRGDDECDDQRSCTRDRCVGGQCTNPLKDGVCLIGGACYAAGDADPVEPCRSCDPAASTSRWTAAADGVPCTDDGVSCTPDVCSAGQCAHPLEPGWCFIGGACYPAGAAPNDPCQVCDPDASTAGWTALPDGADCSPDGLWCTEDFCSGGTCMNPVTAGCLINGTCFDDGDPLGPCEECVHDVDPRAPTFVAGKPCNGPTAAAICAANSCRSLGEASFEAPLPPGQLGGTALRAVAEVPAPAGVEIWAAGRFESAAADGGGGGVMLRLTPSPDVILGPQPFLDVHHRVAIAEGGKVYTHDGASFTEQPLLSVQLLGQRLAVWGTPLAGGGEVVYLSGEVQPPASLGIFRCEQLFSQFVCASNFVGFNEGAVLGGVNGSTVGGARGPAWAISTGDATDIFYNDGSSLAWSQGGVGGCQDMGPGGSSACSGDLGGLKAIHGTASDDVWVVGAKDAVLHYDGVAWTRLAGPQWLGSYEADAIYSSPKDELVTLTAFRDGSTGRRVVFFNYNRKLDRWYGPLLVRTFPGNASEARLLDIAGAGFDDLWFVGQARSMTSADQRLRGWILRLH